MKMIPLINVLAILLFAFNANALEYQIIEVSAPNPPEFTVPAQLYTDVAALGGEDTVVTSYNDSGQVVGYTAIYNLLYQSYFNWGFIWDATNGADILAGLTTATDINESGQVVGYKITPGAGSSAYIWDNTNGYQYLGSLGYKFTYAEGINDFGIVVGASAILDGSATNHAFIWNNQEEMKDLNDYLPLNSGWILNSAQEINNDGNIIGTGTLNGQTKTFLMAPTVVPEPISSILFVTGGTFLAVRRFIRRKA